MDHVPPQIRSKIMAAVRSKDTTPELRVRRALHALGYRFSLHSARLPGKPDLVLRKFRTAIFIHGCFWHGHGCRKGRRPKTNRSFWTAKVETNRRRDRRVRNRLRKDGWRVITVWQCQTRALDKVVDKIASLLESH